MSRKQDKLATKKRILIACVRLFIEQGYYNTTLSEIVKEAKVSFSSFQNIFRNKEGVLLDLTQMMFDMQFEVARGISREDVSPVYVYAVETAIQMTLTELNENLRQIYVEAYSNPRSAEYIYKRTAKELENIFSSYNPHLSSSDFYELDIGTSGIMRGYMSRKCDQYFTLDKKLDVFLTMSFKAYNVPNEDIKNAIAFVHAIDIKNISQNIMYKLFNTLAMQFDFEFSKE